MSSLRETGATIMEENDNNCKFVLIDSNSSKKNSYTYDIELKTKTSAPPKGVNLAPNGKQMRKKKKFFF